MKTMQPIVQQICAFNLPADWAQIGLAMGGFGVGKLAMTVLGGSTAVRAAGQTVGLDANRLCPTAQGRTPAQSVNPMHTLMDRPVGELASERSVRKLGTAFTHLGDYGFHTHDLRGSNKPNDLNRNHVLFAALQRGFSDLDRSTVSIDGSRILVTITSQYARGGGRHRPIPI